MFGGEINSFQLISESSAKNVASEKCEKSLISEIILPVDNRLVVLFTNMLSISVAEFP